MTDKEFPLFPELSEEGAVAAQELINKFKVEMDGIRTLKHNA